MEKQERIDELKQLTERNLQAGGEDRIARQHKLGRLTARERLTRLFDPGTYQEQWVLLQGFAPDRDGKITHVNEVIGCGEINGRLTIAHADDATSRTQGMRPATQPPRGTNPKLYPEDNHPAVQLYDGGDAENWLSLPHRWGTGNPVRALGGLRKVPHVAVIMGNCIGVPAMEAITADFVVQVKGTVLAASDPRLLAEPTEQIDWEEIGGWRQHAETTGQIDAVADSDEQALQIVREFLGYMPRNISEEPSNVPTKDPVDRKCDKLMTIIPDKSIRVYDQRQLIKQVVDDGRLFEIKPAFGKTLITCLARMNGQVVGIIANQTLFNAGAAGYDECDKSAEFIVLCDTYNIPLLYLSDTPGMLVGRPAEQHRIPTKIMTWMEAQAFSTVPKICIIIRKAYGMAISNMCGTNAGPDVLAALTTAEISFMSPEAAANVVYLRRIEQAANPEEERQKLIRQMELESAPFPAAHAGLIDDVIDPRDMRKYIIDKLAFLRRSKGNFIGETKLQSWPTGL